MCCQVQPGGMQFISAQKRELPEPSVLGDRRHWLQVRIQMIQKICILIHCVPIKVDPKINCCNLTKSCQFCIIMVHRVSNVKLNRAGGVQFISAQKREFSPGCLGIHAAFTS